MSQLAYIYGASITAPFLGIMAVLFVTALSSCIVGIMASRSIFQPRKFTHPLLLTTQPLLLTTHPLLLTLDNLTRSSKLPETSLSDSCKSEYPGQDTDFFLKSWKATSAHINVELWQAVLAVNGEKLFESGVFTNHETAMDQLENMVIMKDWTSRGR
jgi:hypothetical protein